MGCNSMAETSSLLSAPLAVVILAAGMGTRMRSDRHKVLHPIAGKPMLLHLLDTADSLSAARKVVVVGSLGEQLEQALAHTDVELVTQEPQLGTAHAVQQASAKIGDFDGVILVLYGDTPFVSAATLTAMLARLNGADRPGVVVLASSPSDPAAYGRVILGEGDRIAKMVEYKDATPEERAVRLCNSGMMAVRSADLWKWLDQVGNANAAGEYYLPDIVMIADREGRAAVVVEADPWETVGINSRSELAAVERQWQQQRRAEMMDAGVTLLDPESVWFAHDTAIGRDVEIEPHVVFGPGVMVGDGVRIRGFCHIEGATIGAKSEIGPFARLRPGSALDERVKIGNFVEMKKARLAAGAKVNHLSYVGDAEVGESANIGAGTITCNYDGFGKYRTVVGEGAFIGSNTALVAPVTIGAGAIIGAGSVITRDVEPDSLAIERNEQKGVPGWAKRFRKRMRAQRS